MIQRILSPARAKSYFLFGPRQTGKSTFVKNHLRPKDLYIDLLPQRSFLEYARTPGRFRGEVLAHLRRHGAFTCVVDEIQKLPALLDEIHALIETTPVRFALTGSSARKLKRGASNLLAGRAYTYRLFPLTFGELGAAFDLERSLCFGTLPALWEPGGEDPREFLTSYVDTYLREEIQAEGIVRSLAPFSGFLDVAAATDGQVVNAANVARECGVSLKTAQEYYRILEDTFLAIRVPAWTRSTRASLVSHPRYYFFDPGVTNALTHQISGALDPVTRGRRFEQFVIQQVHASIAYARLDLQMFYFRTYSGAEVDLVLCRGQNVVAAVEIKSSASAAGLTRRGLTSFLDHCPGAPAFVLCVAERERLLGPRILACPWQDFIRRTLPKL